MKAFPWQEVMGFGLGVLKLHPAQFWAMSPRELAAAMDVHASRRSTPSRAEFDALLESNPD